MRPSPQPQEAPSLTPISSALRPTVSSPAPTQSIFAGDLIGDSGTNRWVATIAITTKTRASQKIHS